MSLIAYRLLQSSRLCRVQTTPCRCLKELTCSHMRKLLTWFAWESRHTYTTSVILSAWPIVEFDVGRQHRQANQASGLGCAIAKFAHRRHVGRKLSMSCTPLEAGHTSTLFRWLLGRWVQSTASGLHACVLAQVEQDRPRLSGMHVNYLVIRNEYTRAWPWFVSNMVFELAFGVLWTLPCS